MNYYMFSNSLPIIEIYNAGHGSVALNRITITAVLVGIHNWPKTFWAVYILNWIQVLYDTNKACIAYECMNTMQLLMKVVDFMYRLHVSYVGAN